MCFCVHLRTRLPNGDESGAGLGKADRPWGGGETDAITIYGGFALNGWCYSKDSVMGPDITNRAITPRAVRHVSQTPVFADAIVFQTFPSNDDLPSSDLYNGDTNNLLGMSDITIARHGDRPASVAPRHFDISQRLPGMIDVGLYDGHAEKSPLENLWNYYWTADWLVPYRRPR